jgi:iron complex outermembrane receptor protein
MDFFTFPEPSIQNWRLNKINKVIKAFFEINSATKRKFIMRIKLVTILLFAACLHLSAATYSQNITITEKNANLETVLNKVEKQSGYDVFLQTELLAKSNKVTIDIKNLPMDKALEKIFKAQPLTYAIVGHTIVLKDKAINQINKNLLVAQDGIISGRILDAQSKEPLIGATVIIKGTTKSTSTALDGSFKLNVASVSSTTLVISYIGYVSKEVEVTNQNIGTILLDPTSASVSEVTVTANPSLKINRQTPIAASSVNQLYIEEKGAGAEFPELMKMTPGVTVTRGGGGYGDSRINIRGFASNNVALLINGIPVNDVEAGKIYWNDWAGLQDVTTSMQVQRGMGASSIAVPSLGGTIDITTKSTDKQAGGVVAQSIGSYGELKTLVSYSTGLSDKGWASSFLLSKATGNSPGGEGLNYTGYNYFANVSKLLGTNQTISFSIMGASQTHGQRYTYNTIPTYQGAPQGGRYNSDWGYLNGQVFSAEQNFYNKPLASVNYNWNINKTTSWSTVVYATYGTGAANYLTGKPGVSFSLTPGLPNTVPRTGGTYSPIDFNAIIKNNMAPGGDGSANMYMQDVENDHKQYGALTSIKKKVGNITYLAGLDLRYYEGEHFDKVSDLFGASFVQDTRSNSATAPSGNINNPNAHATVGQKFNNDYTYDVASEGAYAQAEYVKNNLSAVVTLAGSNTSNRRIDYFNYLNTDPNRETKWLNFLGYQAKGGLNYNLDAQNNVYANIGYIQRAPLVGSMFLNKDNTVNTNAIPEKLFDTELGYGFTSATFSADVNLYRSLYLDRSKVVTSGTANPDGTFNTINISGLNEVHQGVEVSAKYRPIKDVVLGGMLSVGDYHYTSNTGPAQVTSDNGTTTTISSLLLKGLKIGEPGTGATSAQTTAGASLDVKVMPKVTIGADYLFYGKYYASYDPSKITFTGYQPYQIPNFSTLDLNVVFRFKMASFDAEFIGNVYNVLNTAYIGDAFDTSPVQGASYISRTSALGVDYGTGRFYMTTLKIKF